MRTRDLLFVGLGVLLMVGSVVSLVRAGEQPITEHLLELGGLVVGVILIGIGVAGSPTQEEKEKEISPQAPSGDG